MGTKIKSRKPIQKKKKENRAVKQKGRLEFWKWQKRESEKVNITT